MENKEIIRYVHGSKDSTDLDVIYVFECEPSLEECKKFCLSKAPENGNIIVVKNGIVTFSYKGSVDEVNNALYRTYALHEQTFPLVIERTVQRDIILKDIKVIRKILSSLSKTKFRTEIKAALRGDWKTKLCTLKNINYYSIDFSSIPKTTKTDLLKSFAFQIGQALALHDGRELYTKRAVADYFPELENYLYRKETDIKDIIEYIHRFVRLMESLPVAVLDMDTIYIKEPLNLKYNINLEKRIIE